MRITRCNSWVGMAFFSLALSAEAWAGDMSFGVPASETYLFNGSSSSKVDIVFLAEGYQSFELAKFHNDVDRCWKYLVTLNPYRDRQADFNVRWVNVISSESGSDHPSSEIYKNTAFDSTYVGRGILIGNWINYAIAKAKAKAPAADTVIILVNDSTAGGLGYMPGPAVSFNGHGAPEVASHEMGHSFGNLIDEYRTRSETYEGPEPAYANATIQSDPLFVKWRDVVGFNGVSTYEGGMGYYAYGVWRPTDWNCQMFNFVNHFCNVCARALNRKIGAKTGTYAPEAFGKSDVISGTAPLMVRFTGYATDFNDSTLHYSWNFGDGTTSTEQSPVHTFDKGGTYIVVLTVNDAGGSAGTAFPITITVSGSPIR